MQFQRFTSHCMMTTPDSLPIQVKPLKDNSYKQKKEHWIIFLDVLPVSYCLKEKKVRILPVTLTNFLQKKLGLPTCEQNFAQGSRMTFGQLTRQHVHLDQLRCNQPMWNLRARWLTQHGSGPGEPLHDFGGFWSWQEADIHFTSKSEETRVLAI